MRLRSVLRLVFHSSTTLMYLCALIAFQHLPPMPHLKAKDHYAGRFKYLTYWNLIVQFLFFTASCIIDLIESSSHKFYKITSIRDKLFSGIVLPYGIFVACMFWGLYSVNRELIYPKVLDGVFPLWLNHVVHTVILPVLLVETYILRHRHPNRKEGLAYTAAFGIVYMLWTLYLGLAMDIWVYPILQILNWPQRFCFFVLSVTVMCFVYLVGERINCTFWGDGVVFKRK